MRLNRAKYLSKYLIKNYTHRLIIDDFSRTSSHDFICPFYSSQVTPTRSSKERTREPVNFVWCFSPLVSWNFILKPVKIHRDRSLALPSPWFAQHVSQAEKLRRESQGRCRHNKRHAKVQLAGHKNQSSVLNTREKRRKRRENQEGIIIRSRNSTKMRETQMESCLSLSGDQDVKKGIPSSSFHWTSLFFSCCCHTAVLFPAIPSCFAWLHLFPPFSLLCHSMLILLIPLDFDLLLPPLFVSCCFLWWSLQQPLSLSLFSSGVPSLPFSLHYHHTF